MKKLALLFTLLVSLPSFSQQISMNPGAPDYLQQGHLAPYIGNAGQNNPCQSVPYEGWYSPLPSSFFVLMKLGPCQMNVDQYGTYTLQAPLHLQALHCWIGTSANARFEPVSNLQIWIKDPSGNFHMLFDSLCEFDKHQDVTGNTDRQWTFPTPIDIPAGSVVDVYRYVGGLIFCGADFWRIEGPSVLGGNITNPNGQEVGATWDHCATEVHWRLYGTGK